MPHDRDNLPIEIGDNVSCIASIVETLQLMPNQATVDSNDNHRPTFTRIAAGDPLRFYGKVTNVYPEHNECVVKLEGALREISCNAQYFIKEPKARL